MFLLHGVQTMLLGAARSMFVSVVLELVESVLLLIAA